MGNVLDSKIYMIQSRFAKFFVTYLTDNNGYQNNISYCQLV